MAKEIVVKVDGDIKGLEKAVGKADDTLDKLGGGADKAGGKLGGLGDKAGNIAKDRLGPLGDAADMAGIGLDGVGSGALVAGAAVVGMATFVAGGVTKLGEMTAAVRTFKDATGTSWEEASRLTAVLDGLGVSTEDVVGGMNQLAGTIDNGDIEKFGIQVVKAADGSTDMAATLGNVADAMNNTVDPAKRAAIGNTLFGDSWVKMMPLLGKGSGGIREAMAAVEDHQLVTAKSAAEQARMSAATEKLKDSIAGLQMALASDMIPELAKMGSQGAAVVNMLNSMTAKVGGLGTFLAAMNPLSAWESLQDGEEAIADVGDAAVGTEENIKAMAVAEAEAGEAARVLAAKQKDAADAAKELGDQVKIQEDKVRGLHEATLGIVGVQLSYESATRSSTAAAIELATKTEELRVARNTYGAESPQAVEAQLAYEGALGGSKEAADKLAQATVEQARQQAIATGQTFTAEQASIVYRDSLVKIRDAASDPTLIDGMNGLIGLVDTSAASAGTAALQAMEMEAAFRKAAAVAAGAITVAKDGNILTSADAADRALSGRAMGGPASGAVLVGERGPEQVILPQGSRVVPNHAMRSSSGGITVNVATNANAWDIAREIDWVMRTAGR